MLYKNHVLTALKFWNIWHMSHPQESSGPIALRAGILLGSYLAGKLVGEEHSDWPMEGLTAPTRIIPFRESSFDCQTAIRIRKFFPGASWCPSFPHTPDLIHLQVLLALISKYIQNQPFFPNSTTISLIQASIIILLENILTAPVSTLVSLQSILPTATGAIHLKQVGLCHFSVQNLVYHGFLAHSK